MADDQRGEQEHQFRWEWSPAWLLILAALMVVAVGAAYFVSSDASPLSAVNTAGSLLLTLLLIYIYGKQTQILHTQQQIQHEQFQVQRATTVDPHLRTDDWSFTEDGIEFELKNVGDGTAHDLRIVTDLSLQNSSSRLGFQLEEWDGSLTPSDLPARDSTHFVTDVKFRLRDTSIGSDQIEEVPFQELSRRISNTLAKDGEDASIQVSIAIECDDARGGFGEREAIISNQVVKISGQSALRGSDEEGITVTKLEPELKIQENEFFVASGEEDHPYRFDIGGYDCVTVKLLNGGAGTAFNIETALRILINGNNEYKSAPNYFDDHDDEYEVLIREWATQVDDNGARLPPEATNTFTAPLRFLISKIDPVSFKDINDASFEDVIEGTV